MNTTLKKQAQKVAKAILFIALFLLIYTYSRDVLRNKSESEALGIIMKQENETYDVILAGPSHMQYAIQPAQLFAEYGIAACNTSTAAQSIPTTYYVVKEMIDRHDPELVVLDLFCVFYPEVFFSPTRFHQAIDNFPISVNKAQSILDLVEVSKSEFFVNYLLYHSRWKELKRSDYTAHKDFNETYQLLAGTYPYANDFVPVDESEKSELPDISLEYLKKIVDLCKETDTRLLLTVIPYRADIDNNDTSAIEQQKIYNRIAEYAKDWDVDYFNGLFHIDEIGFDFMTDMVEYSHVNSSGAQKITTFYGKYFTDNYNLPDRSDDKNYDKWYDDYEEYLDKLFEIEIAAMQ